MKIKTSELTGAALDWAVAKCEGERYFAESGVNGIGMEFDATRYSTDWSQGGPIIEREGILLRPIRHPGHSMDGLWLATFDPGNTGTMVQFVKRKNWPRRYHEGPTPLIAAMLCYVASKLGDEVDLPNELAK